MTHMGTGARVRVLVVDDHSLVRQGTREILEREPDLEVIADAAGGAEAVALADALRPDVVLMDIGLPGMSGVDATRFIHLAHPDVKVLALTIHDDDEYVVEMVAAGAAGYILKDVRDGDLVGAVRSVAAGNGVLDPAVTRTVLGRLRAREAVPATEPLTSRESEILQLVADGMENREIGERLGVSARTVETHLSHAFRKLGARSRTEAVISAIRLGVATVTKMTRVDSS